MRMIFTIAVLLFATVGWGLADASPASITPPAGWQQEPSAPPHGAEISLAEYVLPAPIFNQNIDLLMVPAQGAAFQDFIAQRAKSLAQAGTVVSSHPEKLCNGKIDGWFMEYKAKLGSNAAEIEQTIAADANAFYMASYTRVAIQSENSDARKAIGTLCVAAPVPLGTPAPTPAPASSPLPFKPPSGWVNMLGEVPMPSFHGVWTGPKTGDTTSNVSILSQVFPGTVERLSNQTKLVGAGMLETKMTAQSSGAICGFPARFITVSKPLGVETLAMDQAMYVANGTAYMMNYTHGATQSPDPQIQHLLASLCPAQIESGKITFPVGWSVNKAQGTRLAGMWMNPSSPGQMVNLITMPFSGTLDRLTTATSTNGIPGSAASRLLKTLTHRNGYLCGLPARFLSAKMNLGMMTMRLEQAATMYKGNAYVITYGRMDGQTATPAAMASMKTLCPR